MAEENKNDTITTDDLDALRFLLHNVKGLSAVSSAPEFVQTEQDE